MNEELQNYARTEIKSGLAQCSEEQQEMFKLMYSHDDLTRKINDVVDGMQPEKLDWAMQQIARTLETNKC